MSYSNKILLLAMRDISNKLENTEECIQKYELDQEKHAIERILTPCTYLPGPKNPIWGRIYNYIVKGIDFYVQNQLNRN